MRNGIAMKRRRIRPRKIPTMVKRWRKSDAREWPSLNEPKWIVARRKIFCYRFRQGPRSKCNKKKSFCNVEKTVRRGRKKTYVPAYIERFQTIPTENMFTIHTHDLSTTSDPFQRKPTSWTTFDVTIGFHFIRCSVKRKFDDLFRVSTFHWQKIWTLHIGMPSGAAFQTESRATLGTGHWKFVVILSFSRQKENFSTIDMRTKHTVRIIRHFCTRNSMILSSPVDIDAFYRDRRAIFCTSRIVWRWKVVRAENVDVERGVAFSPRFDHSLHWMRLENYIRHWDTGSALIWKRKNVVRRIEERNRLTSNSADWAHIVEHIRDKIDIGSCQTSKCVRSARSHCNKSHIEMEDPPVRCSLVHRPLISSRGKSIGKRQNKSFCSDCWLIIIHGRKRS